MTKTRKQVRAELAFSGRSVTDWAKEHGFNPSLALFILNDDEANPKRKCLRGESHNIAVSLGLKEGKVYRTQRWYDPSPNSLQTSNLPSVAAPIIRLSYLPSHPKREDEVK